MFGANAFGWAYFGGAYAGQTAPPLAPPTGPALPGGAFPHMIFPGKPTWQELEGFGPARDKES